MNFKLTNIVLVTFTLAITSSNLLNGVNAALQPQPQPQQQQLRGRKLDAPDFCPHEAPADGSVCLNGLPRGWSYGDCSWYQSSTDSTGATTTETEYCICKRNVGTWSCTDEYGVSMSPPLASSPPVSASDNNRRKLDAQDFSCPDTAPADGSVCANILPNGVSSGHCEWEQNSFDGVSTTTTQTDTCDCTTGNWSCTNEIKTKTSPPAPSPPPVTMTPDLTFKCPPAIPTTNVACILPADKTNGSCSYDLTAANGLIATTNCGCTKDSPIFVCK